MRRLLAALLLPLAGIVSSHAIAAFPDRPIKLVVSMPPGGVADTVARLVASKVAEKLGQPIVVENKPGADGSIAADQVARATPDGYTLAWVTNSHVVSPLTLTVPYDALTSFAPVIQVAQAPDVLVVPANSPFNTIADFVGAAKAKPGEVVYGSAGVSTPSSLEIVLLSNLTGIKMLAVPYKGGSEVMLALMNGSVQIYFATISTAIPYLTSGKMKALAVSSKTRAPQLPNVPTVAEALNLPTFEGGNWLGVLAPSATPTDVVAALNKAFAGAINAPDVRAKLAELGWTPIANSPEQFASVIKNDLARWSDTFKASGGKP